MRRFHIVAVTPDLENALAVQTSVGWLLPCLEDDARSELPAQVVAMLTRMAGVGGDGDGGVRVELVHEAPLAGGMAAPEEFQGCCVAVVARDGRSGADINGAVPVERLVSGRPLLPIQGEALAGALRRLRAAPPLAPFDSPTQVNEAFDWARREIASRTGAEVLRVERHRCTRHEYVAWIETTTAGRIYLKGGVERVEDEAVLTGLLREIGPEQFPETLAVDRRHQRWLYRELPGRLLIGSLLTAERASAAVCALASIQKRGSDDERIERLLASRRMNAVELFERADRIVEGAWTAWGTTARGGADPGALTQGAMTRGRGVAADGAATRPAATHGAAAELLDAWRALRVHTLRECDAIDSMRLPLTLAFSDFWGRNILLRPDGGIGFIDVEHCYWSYPVLPLWRFLNEIERRMSGYSDAIRTHVENSFIKEWADAAQCRAMRRAIDALPLLGRLFGIVLVSHELDLHERGLGASLPEGCRVAYLARHVERFIGRGI